MSLNRVKLLATITDTKFRQTTGGNSILDLSVAGDLPSTFYLPASIIGKYGNVMKDHLQAGMTVLIDAHLHQSSWDKPDGGKGTKTSITVDSIITIQQGEGQTTTDAQQKERLKDSINEVMLEGNLIRAMQFGQTESKEGKPSRPYARFQIAVDDYKQGGQKHTNYIACTAWDDLALNLKERNPSVGAGLVIMGYVRNESWKDKDGNPMRDLKVIATRVHYAQRRAANQSATPTSTSTPSGVNQAPKPQSAPPVRPTPTPTPSSDDLPDDLLDAEHHDRPWEEDVPF